MLLILNVRIEYPVVIHVLKKFNVIDAYVRHVYTVHAHAVHIHAVHAHALIHINLFSSSSRVMHAHVMHSHGMHTQDVHCMLYVRINSGMPTPMFQVQYYSESWHVATNQQHQAYYRPRVIQTIGMRLNKLPGTCRLLILKNAHFFLLYIAEQFYVNYKMAPE